MKRGKETKKNLIFIAILIAVLALNAPLKTFADTAVETLNAQKSDRQKKLDDLNNQIKNYQQQIAVTQNKSSTLKNEVLIYDSQIASTQLAIEVKQTQIEDSQMQIDELQKVIDQKQADIDNNKQVLAKLIVQLNEYDAEYNFKTTLGSNNLSEFLDQVQYTQSLNDKIYQLEQKIKNLKNQIVAQQKNLKIQLQKLQDLKTQLQITREALTAQRNQKQQLLNQTRGLEKNYQKLLASSKQDEANLQKEIDDLDAQIRAKLGKKYLVARGALAWPMDGIMTQVYGNTGFTALGYNFHNGIDIAAPAGQPIYAAAGGTVLYTDSSDSTFGNWVAVKSTITSTSGQRGIIALYAHMRRYVVTPGQELSQGDLIGYEGNTGNTTKKLYGPERGYHLHFGIYDTEGFGINDGKYQNIYGPYRVPYGYTYSPLDFLSSN